MSATPTDPMEFLKSLWGNTGMPLPGLVTPTLDTNELEKRIADLKAISQSASNLDANANPFANPALWPWNLMQGTDKPATAAEGNPETADHAAAKAPGKKAK